VGAKRLRVLLKYVVDDVGSASVNTARTLLVASQLESKHRG